MTGAELIKWIQDNHAENMDMLVQYRDGDGIIEGCTDVEPCFCTIRAFYVHDYDVVYDIGDPDEDPEYNAVAF